MDFLGKGCFLVAGWHFVILLALERIGGSVEDGRRGGSEKKSFEWMRMGDRDSGTFGGRSVRFPFCVL